MPVDKFGRNGDRATPVYTEIRVSLKNTPLNPLSDSFVAASIISRFESGLFG